MQIIISASRPDDVFDYYNSIKHALFKMESVNYMLSNFVTGVSFGNFGGSGGGEQRVKHVQPLAKKVDNNFLFEIRVI